MYPSLFLSKEIEVLGAGDIWLSETPNIPGSKSFGSSFPRLATYIEANLKNIGITLVINVHLDHMEESTRVEQIKVLAKQIEPLKANKKIILMGDFNSSPAGPVREIINRVKPF